MTAHVPHVPSRAPGPTGGLLLGSLRPFQADPLAFLTRTARAHGPVARLRFGPITAHLVSHPAPAEQVLSLKAADFDKNSRSAAMIGATCGASLLSGDTATWQRHRRLIQPVFQPRFLDGIDPLTDAAIDKMFAHWRVAAQDGQPVDIVAQMMRLSIGLVTGFLFSSGIDPQRIDSALTVLLADTWRRMQSLVDPAWLSPRLHRRAFRDALAEIDTLAFALIRARRSASDRPDDLLSRLLDAHEAQGGDRLTDRELRDAAVTLLLSGHETLASALAWTFILLAQNPEWQGFDPGKIWSETLRLYPPIWILERRATREVEIGGFRIGRGSSVLISPWVMQRDPDFWPDPDRFDPTRFDDEASGSRPRHAWLPFGLGPHRCVGLHLANRIAMRLQLRVRAEFDLHLPPGQSLGLLPGITLRHAGPVLMQVVPK